MPEIDERENGRMPKSKNSQNGNAIRYEILGQMVAQKRATEYISLRALERETGISASTLSRIENGKTADMEHVAALARWLGVKIERFVGSYNEDLPGAVKAMLLADPNIGKDEADALSGTFSALYRQMSRA
jgi:transcriptional regulator with XRE-family HTH domain